MLTHVKLTDEFLYLWKLFDIFNPSTQQENNMHLSQLIDNASASVTNINLTLQKSKMALMSDTSFTQEQKQAILTMLKPTEDAISQASQSFVISDE